MDFIKMRAEEAKASFSNSSVGQKVGELKDKIDEEIEEKKRMLKEFEEEKRRMIAEMIQAKLEAMYDHGMNIAAQTVKEGMKDPYMPQFVKNMCDEMVDGVWVDVKKELKDEILKGFSDMPPIAHGEAPGCCGAILAFLRYNLMPYDRGFWRLIRNPVWWIFTLITLVPVYGVVQIMYLFQFLLIDKSDEYQLFEFIRAFKSLQFITLGIIGSVVGSIQYYVCVCQVPMSCDKHGPKENFWTMVLFCVQVVIVFLAFLMMNCSEKKGGFFYQMEAESKQRIAATATHGHRMGTLHSLTGGDEVDEKTKLMNSMRYKSDREMLAESKSRLMKFLVYDLIIFLLCIGLIFWLAFYNMLDQDSTVLNSPDSIKDDNWKFVMGLYWVKCFYGFMSFPFILLKVPLISTLISHARPTAYNPYGVTVPYIGIEEQRPVPWDPERQPMVKSVELL